MQKLPCIIFFQNTAENCIKCEYDYNSFEEKVEISDLFHNANCNKKKCWLIDSRGCMLTKPLRCFIGGYPVDTFTSKVWCEECIYNVIHEDYNTIFSHCMWYENQSRKYSLAKKYFLIGKKVGDAKRTILEFLCIAEKLKDIENISKKDIEKRKKRYNAIMMKNYDEK